MSRFTPNKFVDFYASIQNKSGGDQAPNNPGLFCVSEPGMQLPCFPGNSDSDSFAGARSRHPGGVSVLLGDGSVRFVKDTVNAAIWIGLNSIAGGEVISADAY